VCESKYKHQKQLSIQVQQHENKLMRISLQRPWRISTTRSAQSKFRVEHMSIFSLSALLPFGARRGIRGVCVRRHTGGNNENLIISRPGTLRGGCIKIRNEHGLPTVTTGSRFVIFSEQQQKRHAARTVV
jgi:hypothetical protein